jgi:hypothetical protein
MDDFSYRLLMAIDRMVAEHGAEAGRGGNRFRAMELFPTSLSDQLKAGRWGHRDLDVLNQRAAVLGLGWRIEGYAKKSGFDVVEREAEAAE